MFDRELRSADRLATIDGDVRDHFCKQGVVGSSPIISKDVGGNTTFSRDSLLTNRIHGHFPTLGPAARSESPKPSLHLLRGQPIHLPHLEPLDAGRARPEMIECVLLGFQSFLASIQSNLPAMGGSHAWMSAPSSQIHSGLPRLSYSAVA